MDFYKNVKLERKDDNTFVLTIKINEIFSQTFTLQADQLEHIINSFRKVK